MASSAGELLERIRAATGSGLTMVAAGGSRFSVRGESSAKWFLGKKSVSFEALLMLDSETLSVIYWEMLTERSSGITAGVFMEKYSQKGATLSESGSGKLPSGESYSYDFGSYRARIREVAEAAGWQFKQVLKKPKD